MHKLINFESYNETAPERMYFHFFKNQKQFPSIIVLEAVNEEVLKFINKSFEYICEYKYVSCEEKQEEPADDESGLPFFNGFSSSNIIYFKDESTKDAPILIRIWISEENTTISLISTDIKRVNKISEKILSKYKKLPEFDKETYFGLLYKDAYGIKVKRLPLRKGPWDNLDIPLNYGKGFIEVDKKIKEKLDSDKGNLFLLNGGKGTGKSYYIKHLSKHFGGKKKFIFIPTHYIDALSSPDLLPVLLKNPNSVLVLEDAEKVLVSREEDIGNSSLVSSLLNLSDGILHDVLSCKIIATFNTSISKIDTAATRQGRLAYQHEFKPLSIEDAQILVDKLKINKKIDSPMTVSEIYNLENENGHKPEVKEERKIGFGI